MVQETLIAAWNAKATRRGDTRVWMMGILRLKIADHYRRRYRESARTIPQHDAFPGCFNAHDGHWNTEHMPEPADTACAHTASLNELREELSQCQEKLPPSASRLFKLREVEGFSTEEITEMTGVNANLLWVTLHKARAAMRVCLEKGGRKGAAR